MPTPASMVGPIFAGVQLEQAIIDTIKLWIPVYLPAAEIRVTGARVGLPMPRGYTTRNTFSDLPEDQLPMCIVISPGTAGTPVKEGGKGVYRAPWRVVVGCVVSTRTQQETNAVSKIYGAAIRQLLLHKGTLGGVADNVIWEEESYDDIPQNDPDRSLMVSMIVFVFWVDNVATRFGGPKDPPGPDEQPDADWPEVDTVIIDLVKEAI